jgi:CheY-like chemotaxis protein
MKAINRAKLPPGMEDVSMTHSLVGQTVLVVEDEVLVSLDMAALLGAEGAEVISARTLREAFAASLHVPISVAILDVNLGSADCGPICRELARRKVPFIFYTGYRTGGVLEEFPRASILAKPATKDQLLDCLAGAMSDHLPRRRYC